MCFTDLSWVTSPWLSYITTWIWNYGDGSPNDTIYFPNDPNVCHLYDTTGVFPVTLEVIDDYGFNSVYTLQVEVIPRAIANFDFTGACEDMEVQFTDLSEENGGGAIVSWAWNFGDPASGITNTSTLQNPVHTFSAAGVTYNVTLIVNNLNGCADTVIRPVYVRPAPAVAFTHSEACSGVEVTFTADTLVMAIDSIASWSWDFGDGSSPYPDPIAITHTFTVPGVYVVTLTVTDLSGCVNSVSDTLEVHPSPVAGFYWEVPACQGTAVQFHDESYMPAGYTGFITQWIWDFGDGTTQTVSLPASPDVQHLYTTAGLTYAVTLTVITSDSCRISITKVLDLSPSPTAAFTVSNITCAGQMVQFTDESQANGGTAIVTWQWNFGDPASGINNTSTLQNPGHVFTAPGVYTVTLIVSNAGGCSDTTSQPVTIGGGPLAQFTADTVCAEIGRASCRERV